MCGIVGIIHESQDEQVSPSLLAEMRDSMVHRGPDDSGLYVQGNIGLGHRRLSIIDIAGGHQPMSAADEQVWLTYNGELYNYQEVRRNLIDKGHEFETASDTEVILKAYLQWGADAVTRFNGMFAFAIWDARTKRLILVRDRMGIKPLYWTKIGNTVLFASEIKAFFPYPGFQRRANLNAVSSYLTFRQAVGPLCFFEGVNEVAPGQIMSFGDGSINSRTYWQLEPRSPQDFENVSENELREQALDKLHTAVKRRMISDVPIGAYLSGGLDSSLVVALMSEQSKSPIRSFSIGYPEKGFDETPFADQVAQHCKSKHMNFILAEEDYYGIWRKLIRHRDTPLSIPHEIPLFQLSSFMKDHVTVALSGEGADELFGGYGRVQRSPMDWNKISAVKSLMGQRAADTFGRWAGLCQKGPPVTYPSHLEHFYSVYNWMPFKEKQSLLSGDFLASIGEDEATKQIFEDAFQKCSDIDPYDRVFHIFQSIHLSCLLNRLDLMSMAAGIEARVPFVDHELIEFVTRIPVALKMKWKSSLSKVRALGYPAARASEWLDINKYLLRTIGDRYLPAEISRRKKLGFPTPLDKWLKGDLMPMARDLLLDKTSRERGLFDYDALSSYLTNTQDLPFDFFGKKVWMLMNVELWMRDVVDESYSSSNK